MADSSATHRKDDLNGGNQKFRRSNASTRRGGGNPTNPDSNIRGARNFNGPSNRSNKPGYRGGRGRGAPQGSSEAPRPLGTTRTTEVEGAAAPVSSWLPHPKTEAEEQEMLERAMAESHQEAKRNGFGIEEPEVSNGTSQFAYQTSPSTDAPVSNRTPHPPPPCESPVGLSAEDFMTLGARPKLANKVPPAMKTAPPTEPKPKIKEPPTFKTDQVVQQFHSNDTIIDHHSLRDSNSNNADSNQWRFPKLTEVPQQQPVAFPVTVPITQLGNINLTVKPETALVPPVRVDVVAEPAKTPWPENESTAPAWLRETLQGLHDRINALQEQLSLCLTREEICNTLQMPPPWAMHLMQNVDTLNQNLANQQQIMTTMNDGPAVSDLSANAREFIPVPTYEVPCQSFESTQMPVEQQPEMVQFYFAQGSQPIYQIPRSGVLNANWFVPRTNGRGSRPFAKQSGRIYRNAR